MKDQIERIYDKVEKIDDRLDSVDKHLAVYNEQLTIHIKRSEQLENEVKPIKKHVEQVTGVVKFITILGMIIGIIAGIQAIAG